MINEHYEQSLKAALESAKKTGRDEHFEERPTRIHEIRDEYIVALFTTDLGNTPGGGAMFPGGLHLPFGRNIASFYVENHGSSANILVGFGSNTAGIAQVTHGTSRRLPCPSNVTSISLISSGADTGLVIVLLTTHLWSPSANTIV